MGYIHSTIVGFDVDIDIGITLVINFLEEGGEERSIDLVNVRNGMEWGLLTIFTKYFIC